jgi:NTP pyrophosphatase (non-canonical NTP hydrolase)
MKKQGIDRIELVDTFQFQKWARKYWSGRHNNRRLVLKDLFVMTAGLGGETGEVLEILKKSIRDKKLDKEHLAEELGDVLYYLTMICNYHGLSLGDIFKKNITKVNERYGKKK